MTPAQRPGSSDQELVLDLGCVGAQLLPEVGAKRHIVECAVAAGCGPPRCASRWGGCRCGSWSAFGRRTRTTGAVVAREYGIPAVVRVLDATLRITTGQRITVAGATGLVELH